MRELFAEDAYLKEFTARVVRNSGREITLDRTAFYPGGAGQPSDKGELTVGPVSAKVIEVRRTEAADSDFADENFDEEDFYEEDFDEELDGDSDAGAEPGVVHVLDIALPRTVREVRCALDWPRRYRNMRYNTALALLAGEAMRRFGAKVSGGRIRSSRARLDFAGTPGAVDDNSVREAEAGVNRRVADGGVLESGDVPEAIFGGLHVGEVSEVGGIEISRWINRGSRGFRLEFILLDTETETMGATRAD